MPHLNTRSKIEVPIIVSRGKKEGPCLLLIGGIHGDETNGVEIVRQIVAKGLNKPESRNRYLYSFVKCFWIFKSNQENFLMEEI